MAEMLASRTTLAYIQGEAFVDAVMKTAPTDEEKSQIRVKLFETPPKSLDSIFHPEWYLDPSSKPQYRFDLERALGSIEDAFGDDWMANLLTLQTSQLKTAFEVLPSEHVDAVLKKLQQCRMISMTEKSAPGAKQVAFALYAFQDSESALRFCALSKTLLLKKDETMNKGMIKIESAEYAPLQDEGWNGTVSKKVVSVGPNKVRVLTIVGCRDSLVTEVSYSNADYDLEEVHKLRRQLLENALEVDPSKANGEAQGAGKLP